ncbi:hypothetical protein [Pleionea sp. CnH1-48]|uniref:hypothetical protein n=1 Tax=Pleionea sp. CnH1-48 TaxID=2954494 RepID=UPI002096EBAC|nr:hypothetical protein [Pleionea sp. CnH1-48]MCO7226521.1 hypothetical protein [Pleionea sp. CnH1-48]
MRLLCVWLLCFLAVIVNNVWAFDPSLNWQTLSSAHFKIHYSDDQEALAKRTARLAEAIHNKLSKEINWQPEQKTHLILTDHTDLANGYATFFPFNRSALFVHPPSAGAMDFNSWLETLIRHEYTHILHLDKSHGPTENLKTVLGRFAFLFPNSYQPSWLVEGFATYHETDATLHRGRGQSTLFAMMMRAELKHGFKSVAEVNMASSSWPLNARYLYGYYFFEFLSVTYGKDKVQSLIENYSNNFIPFMLNTSFEQNFGKDLNALWKDFESYLRNKLMTVNAQHSIEALTDDGFFKSDFAMNDDGELFIVKNDGVHQAALIKRSNNGDEQHLVDINIFANIDHHPIQGLLIAQPEYCDEFRLNYDLYHYNEQTHDFTRLTRCARYTEGVWSSDGDYIIALKAENGIFQIDRLSTTGLVAETLWKGQQDVIVSHLTLSKDNKTLAASVQRSGHPRANIELFSMDTRQWQRLLADNAHQWHPDFIANDTAIRFSSDRDGSFNSYRWDLTEQQLTQESTSTQGLFKTLAHEGKHFSIGYTHKGYEIFSYQPTAQPIELQTESRWHIPPLVTPTEEIDFTITPYSSWDSLAPKWWFPFVVGDGETLEVGAQTSGQDALENHFYFAAVSFDVERLFPNLFANYWFNHQWEFSIRNTFDVDPGPNIDFFERERKAKLGYHIPWTFVNHQWDLEFAVSAEHSSFGRWFNDQAFYDAKFKNTLGGIVLSYNSAQYFARSISANDGRSLRLSLASSDIFDSSFYGKSAVLDWREYIQLVDEHALALRFVAASAERGSQIFEMGGNFSDSYFQVSPGIIQYSYALRGYEENLSALRGRHLRLTTAEWRLPIKHIERTAMVPPIGIEELSASVFYDRGRVFGGAGDNTFSSAGVELHAQLRLFYFLPITLRLGYADGHDDQLGQQETYLSFGTSF